MKERQFLVSKVSTDRDMTGVQVGDKVCTFSKSGSSFYLSDPGEANELKQTLGKKGTKDIVVSEVPMANTEGVHNYTFSIRRPDFLEETEEESEFEWVEIRPGKFRRVRKDASIRTS